MQFVVVVKDNKRGMITEKRKRMEIDGKKKERGEFKR